MEVKDIIELPGGGAEVVFQLTDEEVKVFISSAIYRALKLGLEEEQARVEALGAEDGQV